MIEAMADALDTSSSAPQIPDPTKLVPVTAEDVERRRLKLVLGITAAALILGVGSWYVYRRATDPIRAQQAYDAGVRLVRATRYEQAVLNFDRAIDLRSDFSDAYLMRARAKVALYQSESAISDFDKVVVARPKDAIPLTERAFAYLELKQWDKAINDANHAIALDPALGRPYNARATAYRAKGDLKSAIADFTKAVQNDPNLDNYFQRASTFQLLDQHREALADFDQAVVLAPDQPNTYFARAQSKIAVGDQPGAKQDMQLGRKLDGW